MKLTTRLKQLITAPEILVMPGVHDALSARIAAQAGAQAVTVGGAMSTAALLGQPDSSQLSAREMANHLENIANASGIPVFADGDTGYGNLTNVAKTVRDFEQAGVAGLFIEDQVFPKRCGHTPGKAVIALDEMLAKLKSALDARRDSDLVIMGRTDALAVLGMDEAIRRANLFAEIGCDMVFVEAPRTVEEMRRICREVKAPNLANIVDFGKTPELAAAELQEVGYAAAVWPGASGCIVAKALAELYGTLVATGTTKSLQHKMITFDALNDIVGLPAMRDREARLMDAAQTLVARKNARAA